MNHFDIQTYLLHRGFWKKDPRTFVSECQKVKVKLIHPISKELYLCGYTTMAVSSPIRRFIKMELDVPYNEEEANRIFVPLLSDVIRKNIKTVNQFEAYGSFIEFLFDTSDTHFIVGCRIGDVIHRFDCHDDHIRTKVGLINILDRVRVVFKLNGFTTELIGLDKL